MKEKILFVNSCVRGENESRTLALAKPHSAALTAILKRYALPTRI